MPSWFFRDTEDEDGYMVLGRGKSQGVRVPSRMQVMAGCICWFPPAKLVSESMGARGDNRCDERSRVMPLIISLRAAQGRETEAWGVGGGSGGAFLQVCDPKSGSRGIFGGHSVPPAAGPFLGSCPCAGGAAGIWRGHPPVHTA